MSLKSLICTAALGAAVLAAMSAAPAFAQDWPAPGAPPKALKDLAAPPAIAEQWNGVWNGAAGAVPGGNLLFDADHGFLPPDPANGAGFEYGPRPGAKDYGVPYKPEYQKAYDETVKKALKGIVFDPMGSCTQPHGMPRLAGQGGPGPMELIVRPNEVWMIYDYMNETRRIYTDGRGHHSANDAFPVNLGHSIGRWEGDTLVVDSAEMMKGIFDRTGAPHSDQVHVVERLRMTDPNTIEDQLTVTDPVVLTGPWHVVRKLRRQGAGSEVTGSYCQNNRNDLVSADGSQTAILVGDKAPAKVTKTTAKKKTTTTTTKAVTKP